MKLRIEVSPTPVYLSGGPPGSPVAPESAGPAGGAEPPARAPEGSARSAVAGSGASAAVRDEDQITEDDRRRVQTGLAHLGYYDGKIDAIFGPDTRAAIRRFQHEIGAPMDGAAHGGQEGTLLAR